MTKLTPRQYLIMLHDVLAAAAAIIATLVMRFDTDVLVEKLPGLEVFLPLFLIYAAGNFIEATADTPFLQIGEHKYGKPILDRVLTPSTPLADGVTLALISMDSTLRSNLTVGLPIDLTVVRRDALEVGLRHRIDEDDPYFAFLRQRWSESLREAYQALPRPDWLD